jgi:transglutaminase-like putative cysteine protease
MFPWDKPNEASLFAGGSAMKAVGSALKARQRYGWAARVPRAIFRDAVAPYSVVNEARTDWRSLLDGALAPLMANISSDASNAEVATHLNAHMWAALGRFSSTAKIVFKSEQTPLIYDPMSTLAYGYASCTGVSLLFVAALRTFGVPARLAGTPAWHGVEKNGNHNWVRARPMHQQTPSRPPASARLAGGGVARRRRGGRPRRRVGLH